MNETKPANMKMASKQIFNLLFIFLSVGIMAQNVGINEPNPTNSLHIVPLSGEPLRIEGLTAVQSGDNSLLIVDPASGVVRYISSQQFSDSVVSNIFSGDSFNDSIVSIIFNQGDTLLYNSTFLSDLADSIDTDVDSLVLIGNVLNVWENGSSASVDLSALSLGAGADDWGTQVVITGGTGMSGDGTSASPLTFTEVDGIVGNEYNTSFVINSGNLEITDGGGTIAVPLTSLQDGTGTDDQNISGSGLSGTNLTIGIENGTNQVIDLSSLQDGTGTDDQDISGSGLSGTNLTIGIENGTNQVVDLSSLQDGTGTDNQNISGSGLSGTNLTIGIENGTNQVVDLSSLQDGVNDADSSPTNEHNTGMSVSGGNLIVTDGGGNVSVPLSSLSSPDNDWIVTGTNIRAVPGGSTITAGGGYNFVAGWNNVISGATVSRSTISGGNANTIDSGQDNTIAGGRFNTVSAAKSVISGGDNNTVSGFSGVISGGGDNLASGGYSSILGGTQNTTSGQRSSVLGGEDNVSEAWYSIAGGRSNTAYSWGETAIGVYSEVYTPAGNNLFVGSDKIFNVGNGTSITARSDAFTVYKNGRVEINDAYSLPTVNGANGQVLTANGTGLASWQTPAVSTDDQNITGSSFTTSTGNLVIGIENGTNQTVNLNGLKDQDWYEVGGTSQPNNINDDIYTNGNVAIGLSSPSQKLDVEGPRTNTSATTIRVANSVSSSLAYQNGPAVLIESPNDSYGERRVTGVYFNRMRQNSEWVVGTEGGAFGSPPPYPAPSNDKFFISRSLKATNAHTRVRPIAGNNTFLTINPDGTVGLGMTNPTYKFMLPNNATVTGGQARAFAWTTYSDGRLKTNRSTLSYGLEEIMSIQPLSYDHHNSIFLDANDEREKATIVISDSSSVQIGFIAQDLYKIIPEAVSPPVDESADLWAVDYTRLVPVLVKGMQEQQVLIEDLKAQVNAESDNTEKIKELEKQIEELKQLILNTK